VAVPIEPASSHAGSSAVVTIEDLPIPNMARNRHLAKSIMDSGWGYFR